VTRGTDQTFVIASSDVGTWQTFFFINLLSAISSDFLMWAVFSRVILEMGMALFFVKMEKIWQDSDRRKN